MERDRLERNIDSIFFGKYTRMYGNEDNSDRVFSLIHQDVRNFVTDEVAKANARAERAEKLLSKYAPVALGYVDNVFHGELNEEFVNAREELNDYLPAEGMDTEI